MYSAEEFKKLFPHLVAKIKDKAKPQESQQQNLDWFKKRLGRIGGSQADEFCLREKKVLLGSAKPELIKWLHPRLEIPESELQTMKKDQLKQLVRTTKGDLMPTVATDTFIDQLVSECQIDPELAAEYIEATNASSRSMRHGNKYEPIARAAYEEKTGYKVTETGFVAWSENNLIGASSDGLVLPENQKEGYGEGRIGLEIKCPFNIGNHNKVARLGVDEQYWRQIDTNIEVYELDGLDFVSYCPWVRDEFKLIIIRVWKESRKEQIQRLTNDWRALLKIYEGKLFEKGLRPPFDV